MKQTFADILAIELEPTQSVMAIMIPYDDPQLAAGDFKIIWDREKAPEVEMARRQYADWKKKGYLAYSVEDKGRRGTVLDEFDPDAGRIIFAPPLQGGA